MKRERMSSMTEQYPEVFYGVGEGGAFKGEGPNGEYLLPGQVKLWYTVVKYTRSDVFEDHDPPFASYNVTIEMWEPDQVIALSEAARLTQKALKELE